MSRCERIWLPWCEGLDCLMLVGVRNLLVLLKCDVFCVGSGKAYLNGVWGCAKLVFWGWLCGICVIINKRIKNIYIYISLL